LHLAAIVAGAVSGASLLALLAQRTSPGEAAIRRALSAGRPVVDLPAGVIEISAELSIPSTAHGLEIRGAASGTTLRAANGFSGQAMFRCESVTGIKFSGFTVDGNRNTLEQRTGLPPYDRPFAQVTAGDGILAIHTSALVISDVRFVNVPGFAILASASRDVVIDGVQIEDSGSRNSAGRNNATGGILLEEGTENFRVTRCVLRNVRGNGIWTHSLYTSPRNREGRIAQNRFEQIGRDAIQVGHATSIRVDNNSGRLIGFPPEIVDVEGKGMPVAIDTAGNTDKAVYVGNRFEEINGKCIDLDGFHDGQVKNNTCVNRHAAGSYPFGHYGIVMNNSNPDMRSTGVVIDGNEIDGTLFGAIFVIGTENRVSHNRLRRINLAHCGGSDAMSGCHYAPDQPDLLRSGIYLGAGAERPDAARGNTIEDNGISGFGMAAHCVAAAPGVSLAANKIARNKCMDTPAQ
jgi:hypothetical protein